jgi:hypothetical protein
MLEGVAESAAWEYGIAGGALLVLLTVAQIGLYWIRNRNGRNRPSQADMLEAVYKWVTSPDRVRFAASLKQLEQWHDPNRKDNLMDRLFDEIAATRADRHNIIERVDALLSRLEDPVGG